MCISLEKNIWKIIFGQGKVRENCRGPSAATLAYQQLGPSLRNQTIWQVCALLAMGFIRYQRSPANLVLPSLEFLQQTLVSCRNIMPREHRFVGIVTQGEGWHNYHHTYPWDYKTSEWGAPFNLTAAYIRLCARLSLVWDLKEVPEQVFLARSARTGDGTPIFTRTIKSGA